MHALRELRVNEGMIDFCSNDYLGIATNNLLQRHVDAYLKTGAGGSRLLAGNYALIELAEKKIAAFHEAEQALIFNSGYDANLGVLSSIPQKMILFCTTAYHMHLSAMAFAYLFAQAFSF